MIRLTDFSAYAVVPSTTIREVLGRINISPYLFQIVLDESGRLLGTVTDGDIRRATLQNVDVDASVTECMQEDPIMGRVGETEANIEKLGGIGGHSAFLPIVDEGGTVAEVLVARRDAPGIAAALVMAGGKGTRLGERTKKVPKPLLPVGDRPILDHVLKALEKIGVGEIFVSVHYLAEQIEKFVAERDSPASIHLINEDQPLGTAGALSRLPDRPDSAILVVNGDLITSVDFEALAAFHERHLYDATIGVARYDFEVPFGVVMPNEDGMLDTVEEKPLLSHFVAAGIYYLSPEFRALVPPDRRMDMPELLNMGRKLGMRVGLFPIHEYWRDIGRPADLEIAERDHGSAK